MINDNFAALLITALSGLIWAIRLEAKILTVEKDFVRIETETEKNSVSFQVKVEKLHNDLNDIKIALARIESRMIIPHHKNEKDN